MSGMAGRSVGSGGRGRASSGRGRGGRGAAAVNPALSMAMAPSDDPISADAAVNPGDSATPEVGLPRGRSVWQCLMCKLNTNQQPDLQLDINNMSAKYLLNIG